jgi:proline iminopeptidase
VRIKINNIQLNIELMGCELNEQNKLLSTKPVLIAIAGGPGFSHTLLKPGLDPISEHFPVIYIDPRGTGKSDVCDQKSWNLTQHAKDIISLCKTLDIRKPVLFGYSAGAYYAAMSAVLAPDTFSGLILCNPLLADKKTLFKNLIHLGGGTAKRFMIDLDLSGFPDYAEKVLPLYNPVIRSLKHAETLEANLEQYMYMLHECFDTSLLELLIKAELPTKLLIGKQDPLVLCENTLDIITNSQNAKITSDVFENSGHDNLLCEPERVVGSVITFIETAL